MDNKKQKNRPTVEELKHLRKLVIKQYTQSPKITQRQIAKSLGLTPTTVSKWIKQYKESGNIELKLNKRGPKISHRKGLSAEQEKMIRKLIVEKMPDQLKFPFALWSLQAIQSLISEQFKITLSRSTICRYLKKWNFTPQKPIKRAYQRNDIAVQNWLENDFPAIKKQAKAEGAEIFWGDETGIKNNESKGTSYSPKGQTPIQKVNAVYEKINMISAISNQGKMHFMFYNENMNVKLLVEFMKRLIRSSERKVYLILDNLRTHHSKYVQKFLRRTKKFIEVFYLPSYSPDLNPDELVNQDLKANLNNKPFGRAKGKLAQNAKEHMEKISVAPSHIKQLFKAESVKYAS